MDRVKQRWKRLYHRYRSLRFLIIGGVNTLVGISLYPLLYWLCMPWRQNYLVLLIVAHVICTSMAYYTQKTFVFKTHGPNVWEYLRFTLFYHSIFALNLLLLPFLVHICHANPAKIQLAINVLVVISSYFWHQGVSFKK